MSPLLKVVLWSLVLPVAIAGWLVCASAHGEELRGPKVEESKMQLFTVAEIRRQLDRIEGKLDALSPSLPPSPKALPREMEAGQAGPISSIKIGQSRWTVPWALGIYNGKLYLSGGYLTDMTGGGTFEMRVTRSANGLYVSATSVRADYEWNEPIVSSDPPPAHWLPVVSFDRNDSQSMPAGKPQ